jgi:hypothetical protein
MAVTRKSTKPTGVTNEAGEPEIVLALGDLTISMAPPKSRAERVRDGELTSGGDDTPAA